MADERRTKRPTEMTSGGALTKEEWRRFDLRKWWIWIALVVVAMTVAAAPLAMRAKSCSSSGRPRKCALSALKWDSPFFSARCTKAKKATGPRRSNRCGC